MKIILSVFVILLLLGSLGLNVWQADITYSLPPTMGTIINSEEALRNDPQTSLRIATYNIRSGKGLDGKRDLNRTASILKGFDVVALNEVCGKTLLLQPDQAEALGKMLDMGWIFFPNQKQYLLESFGNAFLSTIPITSWYQEQLIHKTDTRQSRHYRNLATIKFLFGGKVVTMLITHLDRGSIRETQLAYVISKFKQYDHCILLGDLNSFNDDPHIKDLLAEEDVIDAFNAIMGPNDILRLDWIIVKGFEVMDAGFEPPGISDHAMLWAELKIDSSYNR
jgi:endonuclease/exonuclease/phosphatase family metal-dependent hydrolase